jgi:hypothetical protein
MLTEKRNNDSFQITTVGYFIAIAVLMISTIIPLIINVTATEEIL